MSLDAVFGDLNAQHVTAAAIFGLSLIAAVIYLGVIKLLQRRVRSRSSTTLASAIVRSQSTVGGIIIVYIGLFFALLIWPDLEQWRDLISRVGSIGLIVLGAWSVNRIAAQLLNWYTTSVAARTSSDLDDIILRFLGRFLTAIVVGITILILLEAAGVSISPLLGGLGITGVAVALGLQPTLANIFAGAYVLTEGAIEEGDYIELQGGPAGYVVNIGWRSTKVRTWLNNYVIIPNSVMANSIITNYSGPDPRMNILITCGVSYESDLDRVNRTALDVCRETIAANDASVKDEEPWFGFERFGDSNVEFWVFLQATDRIGSFIVTNDLIKRLHARFREEGIEINYPVRKLVYPAGQPPPNPAASQAVP